MPGIAMPGQPRIYLCGFPKSGLHMLEQAVSAISIPAANNNWYGTQAWQDKPLDEHVKAMAVKLALIHEGCYAKGHLGYDYDYASLLWGLGIATLFIYRDLRDVVVSQAYHILESAPDKSERLRHPNPDIYKALPDFESVLIACIEGLGEYPGIFPRFDSFAGWLTAEGCLPVRFEDLRKHGAKTCMRIARHVYRMNGKALDKKLILKMGRAMQKRTLRRTESTTFRKGKAGGWRNAFSPKVTDCFKAHDPGWLVRLGYEDTEDW